MFKTVVHQTIDDRYDVETSEANGPIPSEHETYLGRGYYFWDNHIELAKWWGQRYKRKGLGFMVCEGYLQVIKDEFLDLAGDRMDQGYFQDTINDLELNGWEVGRIIEHLKGEGLFPYLGIRAYDIREVRPSADYKQERMRFHESKPGLMILNPQILICMIEINEVILHHYKVIHIED